MSNSGFVCEKCNRIFKLKHHLKAHLKKKNSCDKVCMNQFATNICEYCDKGFSNSFTLKRHINLYCKVKGEKDKNYQTMEQLKDKMKLLEIENVRLKTENEHLKKYNELIDVVKKLKDENNN
jgi:uncharacterized Zn-finger protein